MQIVTLLIKYLFSVKKKKKKKRIKWASDTSLSLDGSKTNKNLKVTKVDSTIQDI